MFRKLGPDIITHLLGIGNIQLGLDDGQCLCSMGIVLDLGPVLVTQVMATTDPS